MKAYTLAVFVNGGPVTASKVVRGWADLGEVLALVRSQLHELASRDKCATVLIALHPRTDACDHDEVA